ncbi:hypothetical protein [Synechococcus sp. 1G10]|uniref:hypothetical protein n=1 Tax=Synechococcus sp. 1G10 TaxID=2025605 RepID=UPI001180E518|nr:hypothetical protein [Synechococcus sp. 1G10]
MLKDVLIISFISSLHLNEGRQLRFAIAIEDEVVKTTHLHRFDPPIPLEARYLQSISPALSGDDDCFIVEGGVKYGNTLMIVGTAARPQAELLPSFMYPRPIVVSANGPGVICLEIGDVKIIYDKGTLKHSNRSQANKLWEDIALAFVDKVSTPSKQVQVLAYGLYGNPEVDAELWELHKSDYINITKDYCPELLSGVVHVIVREIQRADHGGAFMLLPSPLQQDSLFRDKRLYSEIRFELSEAIHRVLALNSIYTLALQGKWIYPNGVLPTTPDDFPFWVKQIVYPQLTNSYIDLTKQCQRIANLANADGAVVLNTLFGLEAFNAKLNSRSDMTAFPVELARFLGSRGNRHNSMASAISSLSGSIGIVVSQDGNAVCFHRLFEDEIEFFELTL